LIAKPGFSSYSHELLLKTLTLKKKFLSNLVLLLILNLLIKPFWFFGIEVSVQNAVGEESYGFYFALFNFAFIMNILLDAGITNFNNRSISRDPSLLNGYLSKIIPLRFLLSIIYAIVVFFTAWLVGYGKVEFALLGFLVINQFLAAFILYLRSNISGLQLFRTDSLLSVVDRTLMIIFTALLLWTNITKETYRIEWFVYTQTVSYLLTMGVVLTIVLAKSGPIRMQLNFRHFRDIVRQSYPFALLILLMAFFYRVDSVMVERLLPDGDEQAGIYAQSFRILDAFYQFAILFAGLLLPMFSRMLKSGESVTDLIRLSGSMLMSASVLMSVIGLFFARDIIELLYHTSESDSHTIFSILMFSFIFLCITTIYGTLLTANKSMKQLNILAISTLTINVGLNFLLIPRYSALGAAYANLVSQGFFAAGQVLLTYRILHFRPDLTFTIRVSIYGVIVLAIAFIAGKFLSAYTAIIITCIAALISAIITGMVRPNEMLTTLRETED